MISCTANSVLPVFICPPYLSNHFQLDELCCWFLSRRTAVSTSWRPLTISFFLQVKTAASKLGMKTYQFIITFKTDTELVNILDSGIANNGRLITRLFRLRFVWQHHRRSPAAYNSKWWERAIIDHMYNAALYSGGLGRWCCHPTFTSRPLRHSTVLLCQGVQGQWCERRLDKTSEFVKVEVLGN